MHNDLNPPLNPISFPWRGILAGCLGVIAIGLAAPFNDWVMRNTPLVGSFLSIGVLIALVLLVGVVNAGLARLIPSARLGERDLSAALVLLLVGSSFASVGLIRYLPGLLVAPWAHAESNPSIAALLGKLDLPDWLYPVSGPAEGRGQSDVVRHFFARTPGEDATWVDSFLSVPWAAWALPAVVWGGLIASIMLTLIAAMVIFLPQWSQAERLPFPLARVYGSLIEPPARGRFLNATLASRRFWIAFAGVFLLHVWNGFSTYTADVVPRVPTSFDLRPVFTEGMWAYAAWPLRAQTIYFSVIGMMFFVQTRRVLSIWLAFVLLQGVRMVMGTQQAEITGGMIADQQTGAILAMAFVTVVLARRHLWRVIRAACGRPVDDGPPPARWAGRLVVVGLLLQVVWLTCAGASVVGAILIAVLLLLVYVTLARTLAETGIPYLLLPLDFRRFTLYAAHDVPGVWRPSLRDGYWTATAHGLFTHDTRESAAGFVSTALRIDEQSADASPPAPRRRLPLLVGLIALGLLLSYAASWTGYLTADYRYAATLDRAPVDPVNEWGAHKMARQFTLDFIAGPLAKPTETHARLLHVAIGAGGLIGLMLASVRVGWWPLHPVGFLLVYSWGIGMIWFSVLLGWLAKTLIVALGGARLLQSAQAVFIGLIVGEACAAALWLLVAVARLNLGLEFERIQLLPT